MTTGLIVDPSDPGRLILRAGADLVSRGEEVKRALWSATERSKSSTGSAAVRHIATGLTDSRLAVGRLAAVTRQRVRNSQMVGGFDTSGRTSRLNELAHRHGVTLDRVVNAVTAKHYPLLPLTCLYSRVVAVAPVRLAMMVLDDQRLVFAGQPDESGDTTLWMTGDPDLVELAIGLSRAQVEAGNVISVLPPTEANRRRLWVLIHLLNGLTDAAISRRLEVSIRLVERDVHDIKTLAGVGTRMELAWCLGATVLGGEGTLR